MKARLKAPNKGWRTVDVTVKAGRKEKHTRSIVTVTKRDGTKYTLEFNRAKAFQLADAIVDAIEQQDDAE